MAAGDVLDAVTDLLARVIDELVGAGARGDGELVRAARGGDDLGAHRLGDLDRSQSHAAGGAEHEHPLARLQPAAPGEGAVGRAVGDGESRGGDEIHAVGDAVDAVGLGDDLLGEAAAPDRGEHAVAALEMRHAGACLRDDAGHLHARRERQRRLVLILAGDEQRVGEIHASGVDHDAHRAVAQRRQRHVGEDELLRSGEFLA